MRRQDENGVVRIVAALAIVGIVVAGASGLGVAFYALYERDNAPPPSLVAVPGDAAATTVPPLPIPLGGKPARSPEETTTTTVAATPATVLAETTVTAPPAPLVSVFVRGPTSVIAGEVARYCLTGAPTPIANAEVMLDGVPVGAVDTEGCVSVQVADGTHELLATAAGVNGGTATAVVVITANA